MDTKKLNVNAIKAKMDELGLNQAAIADNLGCSRESVSNWLKNEKFPRPKILLEFAHLLNLKFEQILINDSASEPVTSFRKKANVKTTNYDITRARDMGLLLKRLVPYIPYPKLSRPSSFIKPTTDYYYIQQAADEIRKILNIETDRIDFESIIKLFTDMHSTIIPVMWGEKDRHENAVHIYLPDSMTTWIYLNLDVNIIDFKFWMAHELGHVKTPDLQGDQAEDFADAFAEALLFPEHLAGNLYKKIIAIPHEGHRVNMIKDLAKELVISPVTIYNSVNKYAEQMNITGLKFNIHPAAKNFCKEYDTVSNMLFDNITPDADQYIDTSISVFGNVFFNALSEFVRNENLKSGFIQRILDIPITDAEELYRSLTNAAK